MRQSSTNPAKRRPSTVEHDLTPSAHAARHHERRPHHGASAHPGFKGAVANVERKGYSAESAKRIIGYAKAHASAAARRANPRLEKMGGAHHK